MRLLIVSIFILFHSLCFGQDKQNKATDLFIVDYILKDGFVKIIPPENTDFSFPVYNPELIIAKVADFNADGKKDILVKLGGCGTGGCLYALFIKKNKNLHQLAFNDYLKNHEIELADNGCLIITSSEEIEPYNPSKLSVSIFKYNHATQYYDLVETFIFHDNE